MIIKINWNLNGMLPEKAGVPKVWRVPIKLRALPEKEIIEYLENKYRWPINSIEVLYK